MRTIKIISGVYGHRPAGSKYVEPKRAGDPPFAVDDAKAARLVSLKVAEYVDTNNYLPDTGVATADTGKEITNAVDNIPDDMKPPTGEIKTPEKPVYNTDMKAAELREIMEECQLPFKVGMSKADMVAVLDDYFGDEAEEPEDTDELPDIGAEDPII